MNRNRGRKRTNTNTSNTRTNTQLTAAQTTTMSQYSPTTTSMNTDPNPNLRPERPRIPNPRHSHSQSSFSDSRNASSASQEPNGNELHAKQAHGGNRPAVQTQVCTSDHGESTSYPRHQTAGPYRYHHHPNGNVGVNQPEPPQVQVQALGGIPSSVAHLLDPNAARRPQMPPTRHGSAPSNVSQPRPQPLNFEYDRPGPAPYTHTQSFGLPTPPGSVQVSVMQQQQNSRPSTMPMHALQPPPPPPPPHPQAQQAPAPSPSPTSATGHRHPLSINEAVDHAFAPLRANVESILQAAQNHVHESFTRMRDEYGGAINDTRARNTQLLQMLEKKEYGFQHVVEEVERLQKEVAEVKLGRRQDAALIEDLRKQDAEAQRQLERLRKEVEEGNAMIGDATKYVARLNAELEKVRGERDALRKDTQDRGLPPFRPSEVDNYMRLSEEQERARLDSSSTTLNRRFSGPLNLIGSAHHKRRDSSPQMLANVPALTRNSGSGSSRSSPSISINTTTIVTTCDDSGRRRVSSPYSPVMHRPSSASASVSDARSSILYRPSPAGDADADTSRSYDGGGDPGASSNRRAAAMCMRSSSATYTHTHTSRTSSPLNPSTSSRHYYRDTPSSSGASIHPPPPSSVASTSGSSGHGHSNVNGYSNGETTRRKRPREEYSSEDSKDGSSSSPIERRPAIRVKTEDAGQTVTDGELAFASSPMSMDASGPADTSGNAVTVKKEQGAEGEVAKNGGGRDQNREKADIRMEKEQAIREANLRKLWLEREELQVLKDHEKQREQQQQQQQQQHRKQIAAEQAMIIENEARARSAASRSAAVTITFSPVGVSPPAQTIPRVDHSHLIPPPSPPPPPPYYDTQENVNANLEQRRELEHQQDPEPQAKTQTEGEASKAAPSTPARATFNSPHVPVQRSPYYRPQLYTNAATASVQPSPPFLSPTSQRAPSSSNSRPSPRRPSNSISTAPPVFAFAAAPSTSEPAAPPAPPKLGLAHFDLLYRQESANYVCKMCTTQRRSFLQANPGSTEGGPSIEKFPKSAQMDELIQHCLKEHPKACEDLLRLKPFQIAEMKQRMAAGGM